MSVINQDQGLGVHAAYMATKKNLGIGGGTGASLQQRIASWPSARHVGGKGDKRARRDRHRRRRRSPCRRPRAPRPVRFGSVRFGSVRFGFSAREKFPGDQNPKGRHNVRPAQVPAEHIQREEQREREEGAQGRRHQGRTGSRRKVDKVGGRTRKRKRTRVRAGRGSEQGVGGWANGHTHATRPQKKKKNQHGAPKKNHQHVYN